MGILFYLILLAFIIILAVLTIFITKYQKDTKKNINLGNFDLELFYNYLKSQKKSKIKIVSKMTLKIAANIIFAAIFLSSCYLFITNYLDISPYKVIVVATNSMSYKNEENDYLFTRDLNNQFSANDILIIKRVNSISDLNLYDVISYNNQDNVNIIHRIVEISNDKIVTRGDTNNVSDDAISFSDVVGVYTNIKIPKLGIVVFFLQSYYGYLCILSIYYILVLYTLVSSKINKKRKERLSYLESLVSNKTNYTFLTKVGKIEVNGVNFKLVHEKIDIKDTKII